MTADRLLGAFGAAALPAAPCWAVLLRATVERRMTVAARLQFRFSSLPFARAMKVNTRWAGRGGAATGCGSSPRHGCSNITSNLVAVRPRKAAPNCMTPANTHLLTIARYPRFQIRCANILRTDLAANGACRWQGAISRNDRSQPLC
jgi:hypothetical protein